MASQQNISDNMTSVISGDVNFEYSTIKDKFYSHLNETCPKTVSLENPCWSDVIKFIIRAILDGKEMYKKYKPPDNFATLAIATYDVVIEGEKQLLVMKKKVNEDGENIIVIPNEECFELLVKTHLENNHAGEEIMKELLNKKYLIREQNIPLFLMLCNVCNPKEKMFGDQLNNIYTIFIMDLHPFKDKPYAYLLCLVERSTGFFHLRPLVLPAAIEVSIELLKIFADFGPPSVLMTLEEGIDVMESVNMELTKLCPEFSAEIKTVDTSEINKYDDLVKFELCEWISMTGCLNWATGCRMVQWKINNTELIDETTPYQSLFGTRPNDTLYANPVWQRPRMSDAMNERTLKVVEEFRKTFNIKAYKYKEDEGVALGSKDDQEAGMKDCDIADVTVPKCTICLHPVYKVHHCMKCKLPMHSFCGTSFVARHQQINSLCMKCKNS